MTAMTAMLVGGGLALLLLGGELVVRGGVATALNLGVSTLTVGIVLLGFGTSLPELVTSIQATLSGAPDIAVGNVVGSNIANLLLVAGLAAALTGVATTRTSLRRDGAAMALSAAALVALMYFDALQWRAGVALLAALGLYLLVSLLVASRRGLEPDEDFSRPDYNLPFALALFALGLLATLIGARLLVEGAVDMARALGASEALIGVTVVAVGTSLPELAATIAAAARGRGEMAIGNVLGSNIFNVCAIVGATVLVRPLTPPPQILRFDMWAMLGATVLMLVFAYSRSRLSRGEGFALLAAYALYIVVTVRTAV